MTREEALQGLSRIVDAVYDTIKECPEGAPGGHLYAALMAHGMSLQHFEALMSAMVATGKVRKQGHLYFADKGSAEE